MPNAFGRLVNFLRDAAVADERPDARFESLDDGVHAADGLEQRGVRVEKVAVVELIVPEVRLEEFAQVQRGVHVPGLEALMDLLAAVAASVRALVEPVGIQAAVPDQHFQDSLLVLARQFAVQARPG